MAERRQHPRYETDEPAFISGDGSSISCRIINMSPEGAAIDVPNASSVPDRFELRGTVRSIAAKRFGRSKTELASNSLLEASSWRASVNKSHRALIGIVSDIRGKLITGDEVIR
jgi:hypothetical protein